VKLFLRSKKTFRVLPLRAKALRLSTETRDTIDERTKERRTKNKDIITTMGGNNTNPHAQGMKWLKRRKKKMKLMNEERKRWEEEDEEEETRLEVKTRVEKKNKRKQETKKKKWETNRARKRREEEEEKEEDEVVVAEARTSGGDVNKNPFAVLRQLPRL